MSSRSVSARKPSTGIGAKVSRRDLGPMGHRFANGPHFEAVAQGAQRRPVSDFPGIAQSNQADA